MTCRPRRTDQLRSAENGNSEDSVYNLYQDCILASLYTQHPELKVVGEEGVWKRLEEKVGEEKVQIEKLTLDW